MIKTIADLLDDLKRKENELLRSQNIQHPPTIGSMYEGLTKEILNRAIPNNINLNVVSGIIVNEKGESSRQIDCMLVTGEGEQIPYTDLYKCHTHDVLAVVEVKKNLYSVDLQKGYENLLSVSRIATPQAFTASQTRLLEDAFKSITRMHLPISKEEVESLPFHIQMIYHTLVTEVGKPIRIIFGYNGFASEFNLRESFVDYLEKSLDEFGFGPGSFPNLIVCDSYSLIKTNGMPYTIPMDNDFWHYYMSSNLNPLLLFLEVIWTRLSYFYEISPLIFGDDLDVEAFHPFLYGKCTEHNGILGWSSGLVEFKKDALKTPIPIKQWMPEYLDQPQFVIISELCQQDFIDITDKDFINFVEASGYKVSDFIDSLMSINLITVDRNNRLSLLTDACQTVILPDGSFIAGENKSGRLSRWVINFMEEWKKRSI